MLQYPRVIPADGVVICPGVFSYGRFVLEAFDASVLQTCFESMSSLADVHLSAGALYFIDNVCLLLHMEGVLDFSEERTEGGSGPEHRSDIEVFTHTPDPLTHACRRWTVGLCPTQNSQGPLRPTVGVFYRRLVSQTRLKVSDRLQQTKAVPMNCQILSTQLIY